MPSDPSTIDASDFNVVGNTVVDVIHPNEKKRILDKADKADGGDEVSVSCRRHTGLR